MFSEMLLKDSGGPSNACKSREENAEEEKRLRMLRMAYKMYCFYGYDAYYLCHGGRERMKEDREGKSCN